MKKHLFVLWFLMVCFSCQYLTELEDISTESVITLAPSDETVLDTLTVTFTWQALVGSEYYHLQVARPNFENAAQVVLDTMLSNTSFKQILDQEDNYQWRVQAINSGYNTDYTTKTFRIEK